MSETFTLQNEMQNAEVFLIHSFKQFFEQAKLIKDPFQKAVRIVSMKLQSSMVSLNLVSNAEQCFHKLLLILPIAAGFSIGEKCITSNSLFALVLRFIFLLY